MTFKKLLAVMVLLSVILGVDAKKNRSPRKTEKLYRKAGKWQRKLRDVWALLGVKPFLVQPGEEGDECVLKSEITVDDATDKEDYMKKSTVETEYVLKGADVFTQADIDAALQTAETEKQAKDEEIAALKAALAAKDEEIAAFHAAFTQIKVGDQDAWELNTGYGFNRGVIGMCGVAIWQQLYGNVWC